MFSRRVIERFSRRTWAVSYALLLGSGDRSAAISLSEHHQSYIALLDEVFQYRYHENRLRADSPGKSEMFAHRRLKTERDLELVLVEMNRLAKSPSEV